MRAPESGSVARVEAVLDTLRRGQRQLTRNPRGAVEVAVKQLLSLRGPAARASARRPADTGRTYRVDDLAQAAGTTVRNVRAYQERGLLHPPRRVGRSSVFDDTHLSRLKIILSMLDRGYTGAHILEMLAAWEAGNDLADVLGLENALVEPRVDDEPVTLSADAARELAGGAEDLERLTRAGLIEQADDAGLRVLRPKLLATFAEMREFGMTTERLVTIHEQTVPAVDRISQILVNAGAQHLAPQFSPDAAPPTSAQVDELVSMLGRFRVLAMTSVTATLAASIEATIETLLADYLAAYVRQTSAADAG